jgi:predicted nuclease with RNAse H fold
LGGRQARSFSDEVNTQSMRTLGVDLASQPKNTAACVIVWDSGSSEVETLETNVTNARVHELYNRCDVTGIDAPFGWPTPFVGFVNNVMDPSANGPIVVPPHFDQIYFRATDHRVWRETGKRPLSVAADRIAILAMRCSVILRELGVTNKAGEGNVVEVYPAAALLAWGYAIDGLKDKNIGKAMRRALLETMASAYPELPISEEIIDECAASDHVFDAFVASLVTRAASLNKVLPPTDEERERAKTEGWIAIPVQGSLSQLLTYESQQTRP